MNDLLVLSQGLKLVWACVAFLALFLWLRWLDHRADLDIRTAVDTIERDAHALALYLGLRFLGSAFFFGLIIAFS